MSYYWVNSTMYVEGKEVDPDTHPKIYEGDTVKFTGKLYKSGEPVSGQKIETIGIVDPLRGYSDTTDSDGYFSISTTSPDWEKYMLCGEQGRYVAVMAEDLPGREYPLSYEFDCTYACEKPISPTPPPTSPTPPPTSPTPPSTGTPGPTGTPRPTTPPIENCLFPRLVGGKILPRIEKQNLLPRITCVTRKK